MKNLKTFLLPGLLGLVFLGAGTFKLFGAPEMVKIFESFGLPVWFMYVTAVVEILGGIGLLFHRHALGFLSASLLAGTMLVAAGFHFAYDPIGSAIPALVLMALCAFLAYQRRGQFSLQRA